jgi:hypothetical protein
LVVILFCGTQKYFSNKRTSRTGTHQVIQRLVDPSPHHPDEVAPVAVPDDALAEFWQLELVRFGEQLGARGSVVVADGVENVGTLHKYRKTESI